VEPSADPAPELVELREPEALGALDHDRARVRHIHPDLDHHCSDEYLGLPGSEGGHDRAFLGCLHPAVQEPDPAVGEDLTSELLVQLLCGPYILQRLRLLD
jgi:hypothetical protein